MIFLEQLVNQILLEEGQVIVTLEDLNITWEQLQGLFIGVFEQCKQYINIYDWTDDLISQQPSQRDYSHIKHLTVNTYMGIQKIMPDMPRQYWEYNPFTQNVSSIMNTNFSLEVGRQPTLTNLEYELPLDLKENIKQTFLLPCNFDTGSFKFFDMEAFESDENKNKIIIQGDNGVGTFDTKTLSGTIILNQDYKGTMKVTSKYVGIKELGLDCEMFVVWFKAALLQYIGAMKKQFDLQGVGLPFDINADDLLARGRQYMDLVETLKGTKSNWSNF